MESKRVVKLKIEIIKNENKTKNEVGKICKKSYIQKKKSKNKKIYLDRKIISDMNFRKHLLSAKLFANLKFHL